MDTPPPLLEQIYAALQSSPILFFFAVHLTLGRTVSLLAGLWVGLPPASLLGLAWIGDMMNIPFFGTLYDLAHKGLRISRRVAAWMDRTRVRLESRGFYQRFAAMGTWGVVLIAATPMWGCGMWSAILLAWTLRMSRLSGILYLSLGSWIGSLVVLGLALGALRIFGVV